MCQLEAMGGDVWSQWASNCDQEESAIVILGADCEIARCVGASM